MGGIVANAGTLLIWTAMFHLVIGNLILGLVEGWLVSRWRGVRYARAASVMIGANYASAIAGAAVMVMVGAGVDAVGGEWMPVYWMGSIVVAMVVGTWVLTVLVEWPFVALAGAGATGVKTPAWKTCVKVQAVTYVPIVVVYVCLSSFSAWTGMDLVKDPREVTTEKGWVYFVARNGSDVERVRLDGTGREHVAAMGKSGHAGLMARVNEEGVVEIVVEKEKVIATCRGRVAMNWEGEEPRFSVGGFGSLRYGTRNRGEDVWFAGPWGRFSHGVAHEHGDAGWDFDVRFSTPIVEFGTSHVTELPGGAAVFRFGPQVMVVNRDRVMVGLVRGSEPVVVIE